MSRIEFRVTTLYGKALAPQATVTATGAAADVNRGGDGRPAGLPPALCGDRGDVRLDVRAGLLIPSRPDGRRYVHEGTSTEGTPFGCLHQRSCATGRNRLHTTLVLVPPRPVGPAPQGSRNQDSSPRHHRCRAYARRAWLRSVGWAGTVAQQQRQRHRHGPEHTDVRGAVAAMPRPGRRRRPTA